MQLPSITPHLLPVERAQRVGRLLVICAVVGVVAGLGAIAFEWMTDLLKHILLGKLALVGQPGFRPWVMALLPAAGGLVGGFIVYTFAPEAEGHGTDAAIDAYHHKRGVIRARVPVVKTIASALTLGCGGSAGREGPIAQIGAGFGSIMASVLKLSTHERRVLMVAGMGAGIGAIFRAPLAGALFAAEVLYREMDLEFEVIVPAMISSIVGYSVFTLTYGPKPLFTTPPFAFGGPGELLPYFVLALVVSAGAKVYVVAFGKARALFARLPGPYVLRPFVGGLAAGSFVFTVPEALGSGYDVVQSAIYGNLAISAVAVIAIAKIATTSLTIGSGQSGGVFGPAVVIGALLGSAVGGLSNAYLPEISAPRGAFCVVGMAGFFSAAANTPISTIIMVSEMTGNYHLLVPSMWVCVISFLLVRRSTLYDSQVDRRAHSPVHLGEMMSEVLDRLTVEHVLADAEHEAPAIVHMGDSLQEIFQRFASCHHACLPVVDNEGKLIGVIDDEQLREAVVLDAPGGLVRAVDLVMERAPYLTPKQSLLSAMHVLVSTRKEEVVVVAENDPTKIIGTLSRRDLVATYDHHLGEHSLSSPGHKRLSMDVTGKL